MRKLIALHFILVLLISCAARQTTYIVSSSEQLEELFSEPQENMRVILETGEYHLTPEYFKDSTCGNCQDPNEVVHATKGNF